MRDGDDDDNDDERGEGDGAGVGKEEERGLGDWNVVQNNGELWYSVPVFGFDLGGGEERKREGDLGCWLTVCVYAVNRSASGAGGAPRAFPHHPAAGRRAEHRAQELDGVRQGAARGAG